MSFKPGLSGTGCPLCLNAAEKSGSRAATGSCVSIQNASTSAACSEARLSPRSAARMTAFATWHAPAPPAMRLTTSCHFRVRGRSPRRVCPTSSLHLESLTVKFQGAAVLRDGSHHVVRRARWNLRLDLECDLHVRAEDSSEVRYDLVGDPACVP